MQSITLQTIASISATITLEMKKNMAIEFYEFSPIEGISNEALLKAVSRAQSTFFRKQKGFIKSEILRAEKNWISISYWSDVQLARQALDEFLNNSSCLPFVQMVSPSSERRLYMRKETFSKSGR
jgi:hypothetical protein